MSGSVDCRARRAQTQHLSDAASRWLHPDAASSLLRDSALFKNPRELFLLPQSSLLPSDSVRHDDVGLDDKLYAHADDTGVAGFGEKGGSRGQDGVACGGERIHPGSSRISGAWNRLFERNQEVIVQVVVCLIFFLTVCLVFFLYYSANRWF